jgi:polyhydroxyalkanoate synthase
MESNESLTPLWRAFRQAVDPFGVVESCWQVQRAWWEHPRELAEEVERLRAGMWQVYNTSWMRFTGTCPGGVCPSAPHDERFHDRAWEENALLALIRESYLLGTRWLMDSIYETPGVSDTARKRAAFWVRQVLNATAPPNYFWTNPGAVIRCMETGGRSLVDGFENYAADLRHGSIRLVDSDAFEVGTTLATTPGAVVLRNELVELIQFAPVTPQVHPVPILLVAPWINKYYILDLTPENSLIRYLVSQGFTVFVTSWKNPGPELRHTTFEEYMLKGVLACIDAAREITGAPQIHLMGYCIGGTIDTALMAWLNHGEGREVPVGHWTLFTTLADFSAPGEIGLFIDEESIEFLEKRMAMRGYLDGQDMATSFRMLRPNNLIWRYYVTKYLFGESPPAVDVLYWNMDTTRIPEAMHSYCLRQFYLYNRLVKKECLTLAGRPIDLGRITQPLYMVGAEQDHITPWQQTFKICSLVNGPVRYVLATSGHILGVVNPPVDPPSRRYWAGDATGQTDAGGWCDRTDKVSGSWWADWVAWLRPHCGSPQAPPSLGSDRHPPLCDAPGTYVLERTDQGR